MTKPFEAAFARPVGSIGPEESNEDQKGLTKREYFAALAMQGLLSSMTTTQSVGDAPGIACALADALIAELNK